MSERDQPGDNTQAEALRIAVMMLKAQGWKFTPSDVGKTARQILDAMCLDGGKKP